MRTMLRAHLSVILCFALLRAQFPAPTQRVWPAADVHSTATDPLSESLPDAARFWDGLRDAYLVNHGFLNNEPAPADPLLKRAALGKTKRGATTSAQPSAVNLPGQSSTVLPDGQVLLLGGNGEDGPTSSALLKDPVTGKTAKLPTNLTYARAYHTATVLPDGTVLILGGVGKDGNVLSVPESFDPRTLSFHALPSTGLLARSHATATLLTNGSLFVAGGITSGGETTGAAELWDYRTNAATLLSHQLIIARHDQTAALLADGTVLLWGGTQQSGVSILDGEIFDPVTTGFSITSSLPATNGQGPQVAATTPEDGDENVSPNALIGIRFSMPVQAQTVNTSTLTLSGPNGNVPSRIVPAETGMLAFVTPTALLQDGTSYTVTVSGVENSVGQTVPDTTFSFTTADAGQSNTSGTSLLGTGSTSWTGGPQNSPWRKMPPLKAPAGVSAISGQVLLLDGFPLPDVTLRVGTDQVQTDGTGRFLLENVPSGNDVMVIDGRSAHKDHATYCVFQDRVAVTGGQTNILNYTVWMPAMDLAHEATIPVPTTTETVITNPLVPGLQLHLPAGTTITDIDGKVTNKISITPIPVSQPPFPLPAGVNVPIYFTIQPGGGWIWVNKNGSGPDGGWLIYPNSYHQPPGSAFDFWNYDPDNKGWYIYGHGSVSADGQSVVPNPGVLIYALTGAMAGGPSLGASSGPGLGCSWFPWLPWCSGGEPVDLSSGLFIYKNVDLVEPDIIPIRLTRTYRPNDSASRAFGVGTTHNYDIFLVGSVFPYTYLELVLPDGGRVEYKRTSPGTGYTDAFYQCNSDPGPYFGSTIAWNGNGWNLTFRNGTVYTFPDGFNASRAQQSALLSITDRHGNTLTIARDSNSNITQITSPNGRWVQFTYDSNYRITQAQDNLGRIVQYFYDSGGRLIKVIDVNGGTWQYAYDSSNNMTSLIDPRNITYLQNKYDGLNRVVKQTLGDGTSTYKFKYTHYYPQNCFNSCVLPPETDVTDPNGHVEVVQFNTNLIYGFNGYVGGGNGNTITFAAGTSVRQSFDYIYEPGTNLLQSVTDWLGRETYYTYDSVGNTTSVTRLATTSNAVTTYFSYEGRFSQITGITDPLGHTWSFSYDQNGNLTTAADPLGHVTSFTYNSEGQALSVTDSLGNTTQFGYDGGDLSAVTDPLGRSATFFQDAGGRLLSVISPNGEVTKYQYNPLNEMTSVTDPLSGVTSFGYDADGNLVSVTDPRNTQNPTYYNYNDRNQLESRIDPLANIETYQYDGNGNLTQFSDRRGKITTLQYDALNRRTFAGFGTSGNSYESTIAYTYDAGNRLTKAVDSVAGTITRQYDGLNRVTSETTPQGSITYGYDAASRRTNMTVAGQPTVNYSYDNANRITQISQGSSTVGFAYDALGRRTSLTLPNGVVESYGYDVASELTGINYQLGLNSLGNLTYSYDLDGRRVSMGGNMAHTSIPAVISGITYNASNEPTQWGGATLSYDANGNLIGDGTNTYTWNARNQLASVNSGVPVSFEYDAFGRRVGKSLGSTTTNYLYDGLNSVQELVSSSVSANMLTGGIDETFSRTDAIGPQNFLTDALGSSLELTDASGNPLQQYTYEPFGNTTGTGSSANPTQYVGRENDGTGLYFYRGRYYSPTYQAFISEDPIGFAGGVNLRSYVGNNPVSFRDPFGFDRSTCQAFYCSPNFWLNAGLFGLMIACPECLAFDFAMEAADGFEAAEAAEAEADAAGRIILNLGGEGEVPGVINVQGPWVNAPDWASSASGQSISELQALGNQFVIADNTALPFADNSVDVVITNNVPIDGNTWLGPGVQTGEILRILAEDGIWINNGIVMPLP